jgi:hypothetical protein
MLIYFVRLRTQVKQFGRRYYYSIFYFYCQNGMLTRSSKIMCFPFLLHCSLTIVTSKLSRGHHPLRYVTGKASFYFG